MAVMGSKRQNYSSVLEILMQSSPKTTNGPAFVGQQRNLPAPTMSQTLSNKQQKSATGGREVCGLTTLLWCRHAETAKT